MKSQFENIEHSREKLHNDMQIDLAKLYFETPNPTEDEVEEWVAKFSVKFSKILNEHPDLYARYAANRTEAIEALQTDLYGDEE